MRPEVAKLKQSLRTLTGLDWEFKDGQMISAPTSATLIERVIARDRLPVTLVPSTTPGSLMAQMTMPFGLAEETAERLHAERGSSPTL